MADRVKAFTHVGEHQSVADCCDCDYFHDGKNAGASGLAHARARGHLVLIHHTRSYDFRPALSDSVSKDGGGDVR